MHSRSTSVRNARRQAVAGTTPSAVRALARLCGIGIAAAVAVGLTPAVAEATPRPSDTQISQAQAAADRVQAEIGRLSGQLAAAQDALDGARARSLIALDEYQATEAAYVVAQREAEAAAAAAAQAAADLEVARAQLVAFARRSYMQGSTYSGAAALITAADPGELVQRAALLEAAGSHRSDVVGVVAVLQVQAAEADEVARAGVEQVADLKEHAEATLVVAQAAEVEARREAASLDARQAELETQLATQQAELQSLVGEQAAADRAAQVTPVTVAPKPVAARPAPSGNQTPAGAGNASAAQTAIAAAAAYKGTPYAWGGGGTNGPGWGWGVDEGVHGFDCSGLTQYAYAEAGISIPRNSRAQYSALPKVSSSDLRPGDLVFWATDTSDADTIHHVAIWLGNDRILEAPQSGSVVKESAMRWRGYIGAGRPTA
ncbi:C40 family peptidase [Blastococcus haudaquaticus]|uniref:Cell wall-associated hydrolase, NlpC family n=1 Tax=Blastococcus haudaquaticus TaxID=1938745 RepID=A0A286GTE0_9ACTN|nr:C40 family peptidase [Blastococcus haudaquaticus]SOD98805.1 Cell wall-associated hydrolase, NlpC family [Blastococcus haudaquaticus]